MVVWTNKHGVDDAIAEVVIWQNSGRPRDCDISVTELTRPPQMAWLEQNHEHEIEIDVADRLYALLGWATHEILRKRGDIPDALKEERVFIEVGGWRIGGTPDLYTLPGIITDYKTTSVWSFVYGIKADWEMQVNFYAHMLREAGFPVEALRIAGILRDWSKSRTEAKDYPKVPFATADVKLWASYVAASTLAQRVQLHQEARQGKYPGCTKEERWARPDVWAVRKKGHKNAMRGGLHDTQEAAKKFLDENTAEKDQAVIDYRPGASVRCEAYCDVLPWCEQGKELVGRDA